MTTKTKKSHKIESTQTGYGSSEISLFSMHRVHKTVDAVRRIVIEWCWSGQCHCYRSKSCLQNIIDGRGLKSRLTVSKMQLNVFKDYMKPVWRMHYSKGHLHDESKRFVRVEMRLWIYAAQVGRPFLKTKLTSWVISLTIHSIDRLWVSIP